MKNQIKLKTAIKNGSLISISDSEDRQFFKNCYCPDENCNALLIARKGKKRAHHFAHESNSPPCYGLETSLHLRAKELIQKLDTLEIPSYSLPLDLCYHYFYNELLTIEKNNEFEIFNIALRHNEFEYYALSKFFNKTVGRYSFENFPVFENKNINLSKFIIQSEKMEGSIIPDITLTNKRTAEKFYIEIGVTHLIDEHKRRIIEENDLTVLEIDFSKYYKVYNTPEHDLEEYLRDEKKFKNKSSEKYYSISKRWINISEIGRFLDHEKNRIISEFTLVLKSLKRLYHEEILDLFLEELKSYNSEVNFSEKEFINRIKNKWVNNDILCLLESSIIFDFFKDLSFKTPKAQGIIAKNIKREQDRIDLRNRLWNY